MEDIEPVFALGYLVSHVEEGAQVALVEKVGKLVPLLLAGVDAGGIVGADVQEDEGALGDVLAEAENVNVSSQQRRKNVELGAGPKRRRTLRSSIMPEKSRPHVAAS
jgi:hypothetical protein